MSAVAVQLAEAVVERINGGTYSMPVTAIRSWAPSFSLSDLNTLRVTVVPGTIATGEGSRHHTQHDYQVAVGIQKRITEPQSTAESDALALLTQEIADQLLRWHPEGVAGFLSLEYEAAPDPELLRSHVWTAAIVVTYAALR